MSHPKGIVYYGVPCHEGTAFPWDEDSDCDEDIWWLKQKGCDLVNVDYTQQRELLREHPKPFELVNIGSLDYECYALAVPGTVKRTYEEGDAEPLDLMEMLKAVPGTCNKVQRFMEFINKHMKPENDDLKDLNFYLGQYYG